MKQNVKIIYFYLVIIAVCLGQSSELRTLFPNTIPANKWLQFDAEDFSEPVKGWDMTNMVTADTGEVRFGTDYYQMMILWALPLAIDGQSLEEFCKPGGFVGRIIKAAR